MQSNFSEDSFSYIKKFLYEKSGYHLTESKTYLLESRLKPLLAKYGLENYDKIVNQVRLHPTSPLSSDIVENMTVNETFFFRDDTPFKTLRENVLRPYIKNEKDIKIWSAACSTGQEPYSIAITIEEISHGFPNFKYEIHASDINKLVVQRARDGIFMNHEVERGLSSIYKKRYFQPVDGNQWQIKQKMRDSILFFEQNLCGWR